MATTKKTEPPATSIETSPENAVQSPSNKRKHVRFKPGPLDVAYIQFQSQNSKYLSANFNADCVAFIEDLAPLGGVGLICHNRPEFQKGTICRVQIGPLAPLLTEIVYLRVLSGTIMRVGCHFLE